MPVVGLLELVLDQDDPIILRASCDNICEVSPDRSLLALELKLDAKFFTKDCEILC